MYINSTYKCVIVDIYIVIGRTYCKPVRPALRRSCRGSVCCGLCCQYMSDILVQSVACWQNEGLSRTVNRFL